MKVRHWLALLLIGSADLALAQTTATRPPSFGAAPRINPGAPARQILIRAGAELSYDSNVFGVSDALARRSNIQRAGGDFSITPTVQLDILLPFGRQTAFLRGSVGYDFYFDETQLNRERINVEGGASLRVVSSCSVTPSVTYSRYRSNAGDVFSVSPVPIRDRTNTEERRSAGAQASCGGIAGLSPTFGYRHTQIRNTSSFFELNDADQDSFDASLGFQRPSLGRIAIYGNYVTSNYLKRSIIGLPGPIPGIPNDGVKSYSAGGRFERNIGSRASAAISIGYSWVDPKSPFSSPFRGSSFSANLSLRPTDRFSVDVIASRSADISNTVFSTFAVTEVYSLNGTYRLTPRISANFGASHQARDFRGRAATVDQTSFISNDEFTRAYGGAVFNLNRRLRLNALVSQQRRKSDNALFSYNNTTVSLGASLSLGR